MAMADAELREIAAKLARTIYVSKTADHDLTALKAAVQNIDIAMNATTTQVENNAPGVVLKVALRDQAQTGAGNLTTQEAGIALAYWALQEVGL